MKTTIKTLTIVACVFGALGVLMAAAGVILYFNASSFISNANEAAALITNIDYNIFDEEAFDYYLTYEVGGIIYADVKINSSSSSWQYGDYIDIFYLQENPTVIRSKELIYLPTLITGILGGVFLLTAIIVFAVLRKKKDNYEYLITYGTKYEAVITEIKRNDTVVVNGYNPFNIVCVAVDDENKVFKSPSIFNTSAYAVGDKVMVYADRSNSQNYVIELEDKTKPQQKTELLP